MQSMQDVQHVFIIGAKSFGAYGGFETFVDKLTEYHQNNSSIRYHVACKANGSGFLDESKLNGVKRLSDTEYEYHNAHCFKIRVPEIGASQAIYYDVAALKRCFEIIEKEGIEKPIVYILACRIGPFLKKYHKRAQKLGGKIYLNPDGHEWKRAKWSFAAKTYWKISEKMMVRQSDLIICDSKEIDKYIHSTYDRNNKELNTKYIAYGAELTSKDEDKKKDMVMQWYSDWGLTEKEYFLMVGRFVPENNYETTIKEFMKTKTKKDLAIITTANQKFLDEIENKIHFKSDKRIKFVGTVYDQEMLKKIRENAFAYIHGHEVGGTNPSLLEAMATTGVSLLLDVPFNREVALDNAFYWTKESGSLCTLIDKSDQLSEEEYLSRRELSRQRIESAYSWEFIAEEYEKAFKNSIG